MQMNNKNKMLFTVLIVHLSQSSLFFSTFPLSGYVHATMFAL